MDGEYYDLPRIGVGHIILRDDGKVLLGKRHPKSHHLPNLLGFPGGHLENGETYIEAAIRETIEEVGDDLKFETHNAHTPDERQRYNHSNVWYKKPHYITVFVQSIYVSGEPINKEPEKCIGWDWYDLYAEKIPPEQLMPGIVQMIYGEEFAMKIHKDQQ